MMSSLTSLRTKSPETAEQPRPKLAPQDAYRVIKVLRSISVDGCLKVGQLDEVSKSEEMPLNHVYASLGLDPSLQLDCETETLFAVCTGGCQAQGALEIVEELLTLRAKRLDEGTKAFTIVPRRCLDLCHGSPSMISRGPHGQAVHPRLQTSELRSIVETLCD